ncbi:MAG: RNA polymerase sigma factor [Planctomycetota bacterium]|jgi:RNA polymerase sigma factor (sigma-70 family)
MTDAQLLASFSARESQVAFERLVRRYSPMVLGTCLRVLGERHAAEDAVQATFMVLARKARRLTGDVVLGDWLHRTARNCAMDLAKARRRRARHEREAAVIASRGNEKNALWERVAPLLDAAIAALPAKQRRAASLYYCCGMKQPQIAREIGITQKAVSKRIADALRNMRSRLSRQGVGLTGAALGSLLLERATVPVSAELVRSVVSGCLGASAISAAASEATRSVIRGMAWAKAKTTALAVGVVSVLALAATTAEGPIAAPAPTGGPVVILGKETRFRRHLVFRTPVVVDTGGKVSIALEPVWNKRKQKGPKPLAKYQSPLPPAEWREATFDDVIWPRETAPVEFQPGHATGRRRNALHSATRSSMICLRGKFNVGDPKRVRDLKLSLEYVGGAAVYLNGKELKRGHLPEGDLKPEVLADKYPDDLYVLAGGKFIQRERLGTRFGKFVKDEAERTKNQANFDRRYRQMKDVTIDSKLLRKGENVLAIQVHRAAVNESATKAEIVPIGGMTRVQGIWAYVGLKRLSLTAAPGSPVTPNNGRPGGAQVWNCLPFDTVTSSSWGDVGGALKPIRVPAARNGAFSGRLVVSSDAAIRGLKAGVSDLKLEGGEGIISQSEILVRCAAPTQAGKCWIPAGRYDALFEEIPAEIPVVKARLTRRGPLVDTGAVAPIWITVRVPGDAKPGTYHGEVSVQAQGLKQTKVPIELVVHEWALPDPDDFRVHNLADFSPENIATHYGVPFWSEQHFQLMGQSMKLMKEVGNRQVEIDLAIDYHGQPGNSQTVVRWIKGDNGAYTHDFKVLDRFLEVVAESIGRPRPLRLNCWGVVQKGKLQSVWAKKVSVLDLTTRKVTTIEQPFPGTDESVKFWKPVIDGIRERVRKRGWEEVTSMGHQSYCWLPTPEMVDACHKIWPEAVWSFTAHNGTLSSRWKGSGGLTMPVRYSECVWTQGRIQPRGYKRLLARKDQKAIWNSVARNWHRDYSPIVRLRRLPEDMIMRGHDGVGQLGVDLFPLKSGRAGRYYHLNRGRGGLGPECSTRTLLAPGPKGPVVTERYEMFREGVQLCEAILFIEKAIFEKKISGELEKKVNEYLDARGTAYINGWWEGQFPRDERLYALAAEVAKAVK